MRNIKKGTIHMEIQEWLGHDNTLGIDIWKGKYQYQGESFNQWLDRVSGGDEDLRQLIINKKFLPGGRILSNRGISSKGVKSTLSNCYVISPPEDNIEGIFECAGKLARTFSYGGGCGIDISKLAPRGATVRNTAKQTSGSVSFMDLYSMVTQLIGQNGRRGALMISIDCSHPDLEEFIEIKSDLNRVTKANISVKMTNEFLNAVKNDEDYDLTFVRKETGEEIIKTVKAKEVFHKLCQMNWDMAEPGILFWDEITGYNLLSNTKEFEYAGVNPCVTGNTLILTDKGYVKISDVANHEVNIWNGYQYSNVTPHITGHNQKMKRICFSDGSEIDCTYYHKFILSDNTRVEAKNLKIGDKLAKWYFPVISDGQSLNSKIAYTQGFYMGDGSSESNRDRLSIKLYGEKRKLIDFIEHKKSVYCSSFDGEFLTLPYHPDTYNKDFVPSVEYDVKARLDWLAGYIDSDGTHNSADGAISISSINRDVLLRVKYLLNTLGCNATLSVMHEKDYRELPKNDIENQTKEYLCQTSYRLTISANNVRNLINLGLRTHRVIPNPIPNRDASRFISIVDIIDIDDCETVYCFNEPINHSGIFNGVLTAQCAEEPLPAGGSCLLGSINLNAFVDKENKTFNFTEFKNAVKIAVKALNDVLDEGLPLHPLQEQRDSVRDWRQIGLGVMGIADMLINMGLKYGSEGSIMLCDEIAFTMANTAIRSSAKLAKHKGAFPKCNTQEIITTPFFLNNTDEKTRDLVMEYGLRNSQLLTIAPTGSISTMLQVSGGIEPIFANYYTRKTESLHGEDTYYKVYTPIVQQYMEKHGLTDDSDLPEYFVISQSIPYKERIAMQSVWQKHIDASISSTVNLPESTTVEEVEDLYLSAWSNGLKGITIYRDGCKRSAILITNKSTTDSTEKSQQSQELRSLSRGDIIQVNDDVIGKKRKLTTGCGSLHCSAFFDPVTGQPLETYLSKGSTGGCNQFMIGLSRMISLALRAGCDIHTVIDQLNSCGTCPSYAIRRATQGDTSKGACCPAAIGNALLDMYNEMQSELYCEDMDDNNNTELASTGIKCPQCGENGLIFENGCNSCKACGYSKCD